MAACEHEIHYDDVIIDDAVIVYCSCHLCGATGSAVERIHGWAAAAGLGQP